MIVKGDLSELDYWEWSPYIILIFEYHLSLELLGEIPVYYLGVSLFL